MAANVAVIGVNGSKLRIICTKARYQATLRGKRMRTDRQRRYRERLKMQEVTHKGSNEGNASLPDNRSGGCSGLTTTSSICGK